MKFLFIVQGEGRGHLTQAITLEDMLIRNGHEVVEILVGKSSTRTLPGFFNRSVQAPVKRFISPNFLPEADHKRMNLKKSFTYNLMHLPEYLRSMRYINRRIEESGAEVVINFYELLAGLTYAFFRPSVPCVCIGHQYMFLHQEFKFPEKSSLQLFMLRFFTRLTSLRADKKLALSFQQMEKDQKQEIVVIPPLLRQEVLALQAAKGNHIHGYMVNSGFSDAIEAFHALHPEVSLKFFWDRAEAEEVTQVDETLSFHQIDDVKFLNGMAGCYAYASTGGFESICEAMYLGKPVLMVPVHIEQECNAYDAQLSGAGIISDSFDLKALLSSAETYTPNREFMYWTRSCERKILFELENMFTTQPSITPITTLTNYLST